MRISAQKLCRMVARLACAWAITCAAATAEEARFPQDSPETESPVIAWESSDSGAVVFQDFRVEAEGGTQGPGVPPPSRLPFPFERRGALYDRLRVTSDGAVLLDWAADLSGPEDPSGVLALRPLGPGGASAAPGSLTRIDASEDRVVARFLRWTAAGTGQQVTWEVVLTPGGDVRFQYLQFPAGLAGSVRPELSKGDGVEVARPGEEGFLPRSGSALLFPAAPGGTRGCGQDTNWCTRASASRAQCIAGAQGNCPRGNCTPCSTTVTNNWHFSEAAFCGGCPYSLYVVVECGTEMHLPVFDMEGGDFIITDIFTGTVQGLQGINDCAKPPPVGGFAYCSSCGLFGGGIGTPQAPGTCGFGTTEIPCTPYIQNSPHIQWGYPPPLPCGPPNSSACPPDQSSGGQTDHDEQVTDVILRGSPGLCGVFRMDIISGGFDWFLFANCDGSNAPNYSIYQNCADALAAFDPRPELVISDFTYSGICPDILLEVTVQNIGCVDASSSPVRIKIGTRPNDPEYNFDLGYVPVNGQARGILPVRIARAPEDVTVTVDPDNAILECKEDPGVVACAKTSGDESITRTVCVCSNTVNANTTASTFFACEGGTATIDASNSYIEPCDPPAQPEWQFRDSAGNVRRPWFGNPTFTFTPPRCPSLDVWTVEARCSSEPQAECLSATSVIVECALNPTVTITPSATRVCEGQTVTLDAGLGYVSYDWSTGETTRQVTVAPSPPSTVYTVGVVDPRGCGGSANLRIDVDPENLAASIGDTLRASKSGRDIVFTWQDPPSPAAAYQLLAWLPDPSLRPCPTFRPPQNPGPPRMDAAAQVLAAVPPGTERASHAGGLEACPSVIYYKVRGTSTCAGAPGSTCDDPCPNPDWCFRGCP